MLLSLADFNEGQVAAADNMQRFLDTDGGPSFYGLFGFAGTGKSSVLSYLGHTAAAHRKKIVVCAPTHKAVSVLKHMKSDRSALRMFETIHKMLKIKGYDNPDTGETEFMTKDPIDSMPIIKMDALILDECSMLPKAMVDLIAEVVAKTGLKVIYVGDPFQLPPVTEENMNGGRSFSFNVKACTILKGIERSHGPVAAAALAARKAIGKDGKIPLAQGSDTGRLRSEGHLLEMFMECHETAQIVTFYNDDVEKWNGRVRQKLHGDGVPYFTAGDRLVAATTTDFVNASQEFNVVEARETTHCGVPCFSLKMEDSFAAFLAVTPAQKQQKIAHETKLKRIWQDAKKKGGRTGQQYGAYIDFQKAFTDFRHGYSQTIHKSQGSTYEHVFVEEGPMYARMWRKPEWQYRGKLLYVAYSRAAERLFVL